MPSQSGLENGDKVVVVVGGGGVGGPGVVVAMGVVTEGAAVGSWEVSAEQAAAIRMRVSVVATRFMESTVMTDPICAYDGD
ncbi:MAG: hypothetical protein V3V82_02265 [Acidimicrobiia bacterium]